MRSLSLVPLLAVSAAAASYDGCTGEYNSKPINTAAPTFIKRVANGTLYSIMNDNTTMHVVHMYGGTPYDFGRAHGELLAEQARDLQSEFQEWIEAQVEAYLPYLPEEIVKVITLFGLDAALDLTYEATREFTPRRFIEEIRGLADGSGIDFMTMMRFHMVPELVKASCTIVGGWGSATPDGRLLQIRALDWGTDGPLQKYPVLLVYHPAAGDGVPFSVLSYAGWLGTLTGFSSSPLGMCEKVWLKYDGESSRFGTPWNFLIRDVLQYDTDIQSALRRLRAASRTCSVFLGIGDGAHNEFVGVEYSYENVTAFNGPNYPNYSPGHPLLQDMMYWDKHAQPSHNPCLPALLNASHGKLDAEQALRFVTAIHATGDLHIMIMDHARKIVYVSNAAPAWQGPNGRQAQPAYERAFTRFDMNVLFATKWTDQ